jgi:hypothetical protein
VFHGVEAVVELKQCCGNVLPMPHGVMRSAPRPPPEHLRPVPFQELWLRPVRRAGGRLQAEGLAAEQDVLAVVPIMDLVGSGNEYL